LLHVGTANTESIGHGAGKQLFNGISLDFLVTTIVAENEILRLFIL